jgi:putative ABC transport system ATP-binding protein
MELSGGQRQRVAIARAIAGGPPLVLADEPTASLDAESGLIVTEILRELARERGHTVLVVTHDSRIFHLADRIVHIEDGLITDAGEPRSSRNNLHVEPLR